MDLAMQADILRAALVLMGAFVVVVALIAPPCSCDKCSYHAEERRREEARRTELRHDMLHRGVKAPGMPAPTVDKWPCDDPACTRNPPPR